MWVVTLYVEGGDFDGETFVCGPFTVEEQAKTAEASLSPFGHADTRPLEVNAAAVASLIGEALE